MVSENRRVVMGYDVFANPGLLGGQKRAAAKLLCHVRVSACIGQIIQSQVQNSPISGWFRIWLSPKAVIYTMNCSLRPHIHITVSLNIKNQIVHNSSCKCNVNYYVLGAAIIHSIAYFGLAIT